MTDWNKLAAAREIEADERLSSTLEALEKTFKPLVARLEPDDDIAVRPVAGEAE